MHVDADLGTIAARVLNTLERLNMRVATVESCTGGLISALLTSVAGSSNVFDRGFVTYSNEAKHELVGVSQDLLNRHGAVSKQVAEAMALGGLAGSHADIAVSVTGIAGPGGGSKEKPVGLVYVGVAMRADAENAQAIVHKHQFSGANRDSVRSQTARAAFELVLATVS